MSKWEKLLDEWARDSVGLPWTYLNVEIEGHTKKFNRKQLESFAKFCVKKCAVEKRKLKQGEEHD